MSVTAAIAGVVGLIVGAGVAWLLADRRRQTEVAAAERERVRLETQLQQVQAASEDQLTRFRAAAAEALQANSQTFLEMVLPRLETTVSKTEGALGQHQERVAGLMQPLQEALSRYEQQVKAMEEARQTAYGSLNQQLEALNRETDALVRTLQSPRARGAWGELTLRRVVELAGLTEHYDFVEQATLGEEGGQRPDLIVTLPGDRVIVVDAKAPMDAYFEACEASDEATRCAALARHAAQVRAHVTALAKKDYTASFGDHLDLVCLFLPGESFFSAATEQDQELLSWAMQRRVLLCSPANLVALLRTVGLFWQKHAVVENADQIADASRELFERVQSFVRNLAGVRRGLEGAVDAFNKAVGSYQSRVLPQGRRVTELKGARLEAEMEELGGVEVALRELPAGEAEPEE